MSINTEREMEAAIQAPNTKSMSKTMKLTLLLVNCAILSIGNTGGPLLLRLYFLKGGKRKWLSSWLETGGWPILLIPLSAAYAHRRHHKGSKDAKIMFMSPFLFGACVILGILTGLDDFMYAYGVSLLPLSTSGLLISAQLAFQAVFALFIVRHKFTPYSINAVVLLTVGSVVLGLHTNGDRPIGESRMEYFKGFFMTIAAAVLYGAVMPLIELTYKMTKQAITYTLVMEMQLVMGFFATAFCTVGMLVNKDFQAIPREARNFKLGETKYYVLLVFSAIVWQFFFLGTVGVISCSSSLHAGVVISSLLPITEILAVLFYKEKFTAEKGISLALSLWGFASYFYGEYRKSKKEKPRVEGRELPESSHPQEKQERET
ncbi:purine permease 3-like [Magnolia sinica]|uniref:purine permease 3-like n=1 Tax=Magnolia sinica TaxID=86752 RepID=UPI0026590070|nr:purine permease 3-like [Magnolia sinica]